MKRNRVVKRELIDAYGSRCMMTGFEVKENQLQYHHLIKKEWGGGETFYNGATIVDTIHKWVHSIEEDYPDLYDQIQEGIDLFKGCMDCGDYVSAQIYVEEVMPLYRAYFFEYQEQHQTLCKVKHRRYKGRR